MIDRKAAQGAGALSANYMTNLKTMKRIFLAVTIGLIATMPAFAQDSSMNPLIPGGNSAPPGHAPKAAVGVPLYDFGSALDLYFGGNMEASIALSGQAFGRGPELIVRTRPTVGQDQGHRRRTASEKSLARIGNQ